MQIEIRRTQLTVNADKAYFASQAVQYWALDSLLLAPKKKDKKNTLIELMPQSFPGRGFSLSGVLIEGQLDDLQGRYNINKLVDKKAIPQFTQFLLNVVPGIKRPLAAEIALATHQWLSPYTPGKGQTAMDNYYLKLKPPYYPGHRLMISVGEFRLVRGVDAHVYQASVPYLAAIPSQKSKVNINTASIPVIQTLGAGLTEAQAKSIITERKRKPFEDSNDFKTRMTKADLTVPAKHFTVVSEYFQSTAVVKTGRQRLIVYSQLQRSTMKKKVDVRVLKQSFNTP